MNIIADYIYLLNNPDADFVPKTYIFASKAAPGYYMAKQIIKMIWCIGEELKKNPKLNEKLAVVFLEDYKVTLSEILMPASEISEQISLAGTEASGTGNMKLMLNGAVTLGTYDGANVEITEQAGRENEYIFGATVEEINALKKNGYDPRAIYKADKEIARVLDAMVDGTFPDPDGSIKELVSSLLLGASWHKPDHYFILHDFHSYVDAKLAVNRDYRDELSFARKCLMNIASAGMFSSDRTIAQYAKEIWKV
jgi:starch phosphorylase